MLDICCEMEFVDLYSIATEYSSIGELTPKEVSRFSAKIEYSNSTV